MSYLLKLYPYSNRIPEAALMARSYLPSKVSEIVSIWKNDLNKVMMLLNGYCLNKYLCEATLIIFYFF